MSSGLVQEALAYTATEFKLLESLDPEDVMDCSFCMLKLAMNNLDHSPTPNQSSPAGMGDFRRKYPPPVGIEDFGQSWPYNVCQAKINVRSLSLALFEQEKGLQHVKTEEAGLYDLPGLQNETHY